MKVVVLAAGKGTRMLPLTEKIPKVLVKIKGKPFLYYVLKNLQKAGYHDFGVVVGYMKEKVIGFLEKNDIKATIIEQKQQSGTGDAVRQAKSFIGEEDFIVLGGDNLFSIEDLQAVNKKDKFCYLVGKEIEDPRQYGVLVVEGDTLVEIVEKPQGFVGNLFNIGLYKFTSDIWKALEQIKLSERGEYEITDAITLLARERKVKVLRLQNYWLDLGSKEDIPRVENFVKTIFKAL